MANPLEDTLRFLRRVLAALVGRLRNRNPWPPRFLFEPVGFPFDYPKETYREPRPRVRCHCFDRQRELWPPPGDFDPEDDPGAYRHRQRAVGTVRLHAEAQDTDCHAWQRLLEHVEEAAAEGAERFAPLEKLASGEATQIITLPATIAKLKSVKRLLLYGSNLVSVPPEIGEMSSLEVFDPYTSYRLHWFPYEITHCPKLRYSRVSTRALYGNFKYRWTFPSLEGDTTDVPERSGRRCSVCDRPFDHAPRRAWISLWVAKDVLPLLVNACSDECLQQLPKPADGYVQKAHRGGVDLEQPDPSWGLPAPPPWSRGSSESDSSRA